VKRLLQILIGATFIYAGFNKLRTPIRFTDTVASFQILPPAFINTFSLTLPLLEIPAGLMLNLLGTNFQLLTSHF